MDETNVVFNKRELTANSIPLQLNAHYHIMTMTLMIDYDTHKFNHNPDFNIPHSTEILTIIPNPNSTEILTIIPNSTEILTLLFLIQPIS